MKDHLKISHLTKSGTVYLNNNQVMDLEHGSKSIQTSLILRWHPPKPYYFQLSFFEIVAMGQDWSDKTEQFLITDAAKEKTSTMGAYHLTS